MRDTDEDWRRLGATEPHWAVIAQPEYRQAALTPEGIEAFYAAGAIDVQGYVEKIHLVTGTPPRGRALDFGCGVGRLTEAMTAYVDEVVGYDISPGMLEQARARGGRATYVDVLPDGPFDWINSFIVLQHIPPSRGLRLLDALLARLAPRGCLSLQVTLWRDERLGAPAPRGWRRVLARHREARRLANLPPGTMMVYDYDLTEVVKRLARAGVVDLSLVGTDHAGHHGAIFFGRRGR